MNDIKRKKIEVCIEAFSQRKLTAMMELTRALRQKYTTI